MRVWRISDFANLNGDGGRVAAARWNSAGRPLVYLSEHPALALLESLVHIEADPDDLPDTYQLLEVDIPDTTASEERTVRSLEREGEWRTDFAITRRIGDAWLAAGASALLRVPSVILPKSTNVLLNPMHADAKAVRIVEATQPAYDRRLFAPAGAGRR